MQSKTFEGVKKMKEKSFRKNLKGMGYRLHRHGDTFDLIDIKGDSLIMEDASLSDIAEHVFRTHFMAAW